MLRFFRIVAASLSKARGVLVNLDSGGSSSDPEQWQEFSLAQPMLGPLGLLVWPRRPTKNKAGQEMRADCLADDATGDGLAPVAYRDHRLHAFYPNAKEGDVTLVGYAGAFDSNSPKFDGAGNPQSSERVIYVPYAFDGNGVPTKAHTIEILGTAGNESISIIHGDGMAITMLAGGKNSVVLKNKSGNAYIEINDDGITLNGNVSVTGGMVVGTAVPGAAAAALPAMTSAMTPSAFLKVV